MIAIGQSAARSIAVLLLIGAARVSSAACMKGPDGRKTRDASIGGRWVDRLGR